MMKETERKALEIRQGMEIEEHDKLYNSLGRLCDAAYKARTAAMEEKGELYQDAVRATEGSSDKGFAISDWLLNNTPEGKIWRGALDRIEDLNRDLADIADKLLKGSSDKIAYLVLAINEVYDGDEYSSRVEVTTQVFGPFATLSEAKKTAHEVDGKVVTTYDGIPDTTIFRNYGHAE